MSINHIRYYRYIRKMSQEDLSFSSGISQNTISDYENYKCEPKLTHIFKLCQSLRCCFYDLFEESEEE